MLQGLVQEVNFAVHGVPATVTRPFPDTEPIATRGIWITPGLTRPFIEAQPADFALRRREPERVIALQRSEVPTVPTGTRIDAPELIGGEVKAWRVDTLEYADAIQHRVFVVPETEP